MKKAFTIPSLTLLPFLLLLMWGCASSPQPLSPAGAMTSNPHTSAETTDPGQDPPAVIASQATVDPTTNLHDDHPVTTAASPDEAPSSGTRAEDLLHATLPEIVEPAAAAEGPSLSENPETKKQPVLDEALEYCQISQEFWQKGELENALDNLDQAYALILKVDTEDDPKLIQQKEDLRYTISRRILEIYASRHIVVNGHHNAIPMVMNPHIQREIKLFTGKEKKFFINSYRRSGQFRPFITEALKKNGLPEELSWLPLIESGFKVRALSSARALGLWQFISSTGYKFGLKRDMYVDERLDPVKSTEAAISYLKELHKIFGDWTTALAAYNCGEGRVLRVIRSQNINYLDNFWDLYERLPLETARYVPRFLATLHILSDPAKYGFSNLPLDPMPAYDLVTLNRQIHLKNVARKIGVPAKTLKDLNPELRYSILPKEPYSLRVPTGKGEQLLAQLDQIPLASPPRNAYAIHRIRSGETLSGIAKRYRSSVQRIKRANNLRGNRIVAGKKLKIPMRGTVVTSTSKSPWTQKKRPSIHRVKSGDSLWIIARRYGTTTKKIQALNNLKSTRLHIGQVLKIHETKSSPQAKPKAGRTYIVQKGDSPYTIAQKHNTSLQTFLRLNQLTTRSKIYPGQTVLVQ